MADGLYTGSIPNLINGVSQQAVVVRLSSQAELQENALSSVVEGLRKRPPTEHVATISPTPFGSAYLHTINRDVNERYLVVARAGSLKVFTLAGVERTVNAPQGFGYLGTSNAATRLAMVTVADHTFVLNRDVGVVAGASASPTRPFEALLWVKQGTYSSNYSVYVNGVLAASYTAPDGALAPQAANIQTDFIAGTLFGQLQTNVPHLAVGMQGSVIYLANAADFTLHVSDGISGNGLKVMKGAIQRFSDLPERAWDGFVMQITGDQTNKFDAYYVRYDAGTTNAGTWTETVKPGTPVSMHASTLPYLLVREADGSFTFKQATWEPNTVGDLNTSPWPSFVGRGITDVFFHRNRLGFITDENICLSRSGDFFN